MTRSETREIAFKVIFAYISNDEFNLDEAIGMSRKNKDLDVESYNFIANIMKNLQEHFEELKGKIESSSKDFVYSRIYKVDLALMFLALVEIYYIDTPTKVVVNEVLNLAKIYSTPESSKFINGVIANIVKVGD